MFKELKFFNCKCRRQFLKNQSPFLYKFCLKSELKFAETLCYASVVIFISQYEPLTDMCTWKYMITCLTFYKVKISLFVMSQFIIIQGRFICDFKIDLLIGTQIKNVLKNILRMSAWYIQTGGIMKSWEETIYFQFWY